MKEGQFHAKNGLYFRRTEDGGVEIEKKIDAHDDSPVADRIFLDNSEWASIISHVSKKGESYETFEHALLFHNGKI